MLNRLNSVSVAASMPYFVTATLPDDVFDDNVASFAKTAKVWMDSFTKRLQRVAPAACGFWRIEWQARKSGAHVGKLVPHFHLLVWGLPERKCGEFSKHADGRPEEIVEMWEAYVDVKDHQLTLELVRTLGTAPQKPDADMSLVTSHGGQSLTFAGSSKFVSRCRRLLVEVEHAEDRAGRAGESGAGKMAFSDWASLAWYHVVGSHNVSHLAAGLRVERVKTWGGVMSYCAKYMAKSDCEFLYEVPFGRSWGIFNRKCVPWAKMMDLELEPAMGVALRRVARRYLEHMFGRRVKAPYGLTVYCDVANFARLWRPSPDPDPF